MEGLIPYVYKAIMQYKSGESPSSSYMRLPGDSGPFQTSDIQQFLQQDYGFSKSTSSSSPSSTAQIILSTGVQSPVYRLASRRVAT